jgi:hypothetical protein
MLSELRMRNDYTGLTERILGDSAYFCDVNVVSSYQIRGDEERCTKGLRSQIVNITVVENLHTYQLSKDAWMLGDAKVGTKLVISGGGDTMTTFIFVDWTRYAIADLVKDLL